MNANLRIAILLVGCGLGACTSQEASPTGGGGSGGGSSAGTSGAGTTGSGGSGAVSEGVMCYPVTMPLITDFTYNPDGGAMDQVTFGDFATTLSGGEFAYPPATSMYPLTSSVTGNNWHLTGNIGDYSGFGLYYTANSMACNRLNAMAYRGISFTISGTVMGNSLTFEVDTIENTIAPSWLITHGAPTTATTEPGHCIPNPAAVNQYAQTDCVPPTIAVPVTATPTMRTVLWSDFTTGKPRMAPNPANIVGIRWILPNPPGVATTGVTPYQADIVIDNLSFVQ
jgi:hypothetical protein